VSYKGRLRKLADKVEQVKAARADEKKWPADPVEFCAEFLKFKPTAYQERLLRDPAQFVAARWSRQSGKTHCVAGLILWSCLRNNGFNVLVIAPALRQSKIIIRKVTGFLPRFPKYIAPKPEKTKIEFSNGSRIQAFPNSPETIRGEPGVNLVYCDEMGYVRDDKELYEAAIFTLLTTDGRFLATSTPGSRESMFYSMCTDDVNFGDVSRHHVSYLDALEPNGPLKHEILEKLKRQFAMDPWRWKREMEAEFADDADSWLSMALITRCVDQNLEYIPENTILTSP
jgi:phage FluMu gp28-like protein